MLFTTSEIIINSQRHKSRNSRKVILKNALEAKTPLRPSVSLYWKINVDNKAFNYSFEEKEICLHLPL